MPKISTEWNVQWNKQITFAALTHRLRHEGLGRVELVEVLETRSEELMDGLCGPKYHPMKDGRYKRAGTKIRRLGSHFGKISVIVNRIYDSKLNRTFIPLWNDIRITPRRIYQDDVSSIMEQSAIRMTYRNTKEELERVITEMPSATTINSRVIEDGEILAKEVHERELIASTHQPDGTKLHLRSGSLTNVNIVLDTTPGGPTFLRCLTVGEPWEMHHRYLSRTVFIDEKGNILPPNTVSDLEKGLAEIMTINGGYWQPCLVHVIRYTGIALWHDEMAMGDEKRKIIHQVSNILRHLKNSLDCHLPRKEFDAITHRITQTTKEFRRLATILAGRGLNGTAKFLREMSNVVTTYATLALQGITLPNNNNLLERLMGEVSKRCKHKWMTWTTRGAAALLTLLVMKHIEPETFRQFWSRKLYGALSQLPDLGICITRMDS